ncbi:MAG: hypothetical protein BRC29_02210 [Nanohaloarchaea archaeon SW_7_43_1]|nr:MAG: hypothetical protein BRC29_02210 [Nanohaloarchaea archaeon SW_7_43_1]
MSVAIRTRNVEEDKHRIISYHNNPEKLSEEEKKNSIIVDQLPEKESKSGKVAEMFYNPENGEVWTEYEEKERNDQEGMEEVVNLLQQINQRLESIDQKIED